MIQVLAGIGIADVSGWFGADDDVQKTGAVGWVTVIALTLGLVGGYLLFKKR